MGKNIRSARLRHAKKNTKIGRMLRRRCKGCRKG